MENAKRILYIGEKMYEQTKNLIFFAPGGFLLLLITAFFCGEYAAEYLLLGGSYFFVNLLIFGFYIMIGIGLFAVWPYFMGLILIGIGQIAYNTSKESPSQETKTFPQENTAASTTPRTPPVVTVGKWVCSCCGTYNSANYGHCKKCGNFRG